ncbi:MAG: S-methyl-5-thioribose-1-phosphate isomerase [Bacteroidetes bacterium]|nr:S-methyl-5-thioribose-1-phosphate isomerase [Bacteroidota bacterium]
MNTELPDPIRWEGDKVTIIDQTQLPHKETFLTSKNYRDVCEWIKSLRIRGAPSIGIAAAYAAALAAFELDSHNEIDRKLDRALNEIHDTRPTAVNIRNVLTRLRKLNLDGKAVGEVFLGEANKIFAEEVESCRKIGRFGLELVPDKAVILTHCHAGGLATGGYGTAIGVIRAAHEAGKDVMVIVDETRPLLQGARLTAYELQKLGIKFRLIVDSASGIAMKKFKVDLVVTGADRIAANGDTANKIGTYNLSVLCKEHKIPFYIAAPGSSFDITAKSGEDIPIEERSADEITRFQTCRTAPENVPVYAPAFDISPADNIAAFITERGIIRKPFGENIARMIG